MRQPPPAETPDAPSLGSNIALVRQVWDSDLRRLVVRVFKWLLTVGLVGAVLATALGAWRFADVIYEETFIVPVERLGPFDQAVVDSTGVDSIILRRGPGATATLDRDGQYGIAWFGGHGTLGDVLATTSASVTRAFTPGQGVPSEGAGAIVDGIVARGDPTTVLGLEYEEVAITGDLGELPAWRLDGPDSRWVIYVHGKGTDRSEALRLLPTTVAAGMPSLVVSYRNDIGAPQTGRYDYGASEYLDLQAAVRYALNRGAEEVVLVGYSMGGAIVSQFLATSPFVEDVAGVVLDAPMLDLGRTIDLQAEQRGIPQLLTSISKTTVALRNGVGWSELDYLSKLSQVDVPMLVFHGDQDETVPVELSRELSVVGAGRVDYQEVAGAGHGEAWNVDPAGYVGRVERFLTDLDRVGEDSGA